MTKLFTQTVDGAPSSNTVSGDGVWGNGTAFASADLENAVLRASASITSFGEPGNSAVATGAARLGDRFSTFESNGTTPFTWQSNSTAQFIFDVSGTFTGDLDFAGSFVSLWIYEAGTLETSEFTTSGQLIGNVHIWTFGPQEQGFSVPGTPVITHLPQLPTQIVHTFKPGGDFDWLLVLQASGGKTRLGSFSADLSQSLHVSYVGPNGSITTSASGLFDNFASPTPVPEPGTMALLGTGLGLVALRRRFGKRC